MKTLQQTTRRQALITITSSSGQDGVIVPLAVAQFILFVICSETTKTLIIFTNYILDGANLIWLSIKIWSRIWFERPFQKKTLKVLETVRLSVRPFGRLRVRLLSLSKGLAEGHAEAFRIWVGCIQIFFSVIFLPLPKGV